MNKGRMPLGACGPFLLALAIAGCGEQSRPSADDNRQLQEAANMLDEAPGELEDIDANALGNGERTADAP